MKRALSKKPIKKASRSLKIKTLVPCSEPVGRILEMKPSRIGMHHGLTLGTIILALMAVGSLAVAFLEYRKMNAAVAFANDANTKLAQVTAQNADLTQRLKDLETVNALAAKAPAKEVVLKEYTSPNLSLYYPEDYAIVKATNAFPALTIKNGDLGQVEIFRMKDFPSGTRVLPDGVIASRVGSADNAKVVPYDVWVYGGENETIKVQLDKIVASIKVIK